MSDKFIKLTRTDGAILNTRISAIRSVHDVTKSNTYPADNPCEVVIGNMPYMITETAEYVLEQIEADK